jgi:hypothetical protein
MALRGDGTRAGGEYRRVLIAVTRPRRASITDRDARVRHEARGSSTRATGNDELNENLRQA